MKSKNFSAEELSKIANTMRAYVLIAIHNAQSGHPGGSLSAADLMAVVYLNKIMQHPSDPDWEKRDRFFLSKAHASPLLYVALAMSGFCSIEDVMSFRQLNSPFQGHPDMLLLKGVEISGGSLGQGLSVAVGSALAGKINGLDYNVVCLMGDGEQQEGSIWEAVMSAANFKLDNLIGIIDKNHLQIDGNTDDVMSIEPLSLKYQAFGWRVIEINGHDIQQISDAYDDAVRPHGTPTVIIADTIKGRGVSFMENNVEWHSRAPDYDQLMTALRDLGCENLSVDKLIKKGEDFKEKVRKDLNKDLKFKQYRWNRQDTMRVETEATRKAFGRAVLNMTDPKVVRLSADSCKSVFRFDYDKYDINKNKGTINLGIAEQNMTNVAAGLAKEGFTPIIGAYGIFSCGRNWDQLRNTICASKLNVKIAGIGGVTIGEDGASHQALEELFLTTCLPNLKVFVPCDSIETEKITEEMIKISGPCYLRLGKADSPIVTKKENHLELGKANIIRFRREDSSFPDAFDFYVSSEYESEGEDLAIIACGRMVAEAMKAAYILKKEYGIETRIINMHTIKPMDIEAIRRIAAEIEFVITAEEHQIGGLGNWVAKTIVGIENRKTKKIEMIGVKDEFGKSGNPEDLLKYFRLNAENMVDMAKKKLSL